MAGNDPHLLLKQGPRQPLQTPAFVFLMTPSCVGNVSDCLFVV